MTFDKEGKRMGSEITESHRAWCESCGWHGVEYRGYGSRREAETSGRVHDINQHEATR